MKEVKADFILGTAAWLIRPLAEKADVFPHHWVTGDDNCESYCPECAEAVVAQLVTAGGDPDWIDVDGGYDWPEEEGCVYCHGPTDAADTCGRLLQYTLIDRSGELDHFEALSDDELKQISPCSAHELLCVFEGSDQESDREKDERRTLDVATRIVKLLGHGVVREIDGVLAAQIIRMDEQQKLKDGG